MAFFFLVALNTFLNNGKLKTKHKPQIEYYTCICTDISLIPDHFLWNILTKYFKNMYRP